ncbi:MAG: nucleotide exchange factor GrpE, partial [Clostridia bacterium]|nr:nucleotide exchange factor GrpE [Clostridia bacterium]
MKKSETTTETTQEKSVSDTSVDTTKLIADLEAKVKENLDLAKYQKAEFENYKRRTQNAVTAAFQDGQSYVINLLLPIFDGVVEAGKKIADPADLAGFEIIRKKLD